MLANASRRRRHAMLLHRRTNQTPRYGGTVLRSRPRVGVVTSRRYKLTRNSCCVEKIRRMWTWRALKRRVVTWNWPLRLAASTFAPFRNLIFETELLSRRRHGHYKSTIYRFSRLSCLSGSDCWQSLRVHTAQRGRDWNPNKKLAQIYLHRQPTGSPAQYSRWASDRPALKSAARPPVSAARRLDEDAMGAFF